MIASQYSWFHILFTSVGVVPYLHPIIETLKLWQSYTQAEILMLGRSIATAARFGLHRIWR